MSFKTFSDNATTSSANKPADKTDNKSGIVNGPDASTPEPAHSKGEAATSQKP